MSPTAPIASAKTASANLDLLQELHGIDWLQLLETWGLRILAAVVIFLVGRWLARRLSTGLDRVMGRAGVDVTLGGFLRNIAYAVMLVLVIMTALTALGVPTTSMFAILGAAGLAVGLALKDSLSNIASGVPAGRAIAGARSPMRPTVPHACDEPAAQACAAIGMACAGELGAWRRKAMSRTSPSQADEKPSLHALA